MDYDLNYDETANGKVVGEFICDETTPYSSDDIKFYTRVCDESCVSKCELLLYKGKKRYVYGWHISELKIYDKPKEISEFWKPCPFKTEEQDNDCLCCDAGADSETGIVCTNRVWKAPQSWCYVEEI